MQTHTDSFWRSQIAGFLDDDDAALAGRGNYAGRWLGTIREYTPKTADLLVMGVADPKAKLCLGDMLLQRGATFTSFLHSSADIAPNARLGIGAVVLPRAVISCDTLLGDFVTVNWAATIGHDASVGDGATLFGHADVTGYVHVGRGAMVGSHASILPKVKVGDFAQVGAGAVVTRDVHAGATVMGVPARPMMREQPYAQEVRRAAA
jgi:sugar O-acyltransferase (sialic acid O-acetyltransferase NeuD family)